jgi:dephospho-CoA kinase
MLHVGLTGNIASGKSHAALRFVELGAHLIDADLLVHQLLAAGTGTHNRIVDAFGKGILDKDGSIDRAKLGRIVFFNTEKRVLLNNLTHPDVHAEILRRIFELEQSSARGIIIVDAALMVETGSYKMFDRIIVVTCEPILQISRLMCRDNITEEEARARIESQMPAKEKVKVADYTIDTSGTLRQTHEQVEAIYRDLLSQELQIKEPRS